ncbi:TetR/AcrR family transcriptional regulator [Nocardia vermiculata]|uniref:TetR/AcrR family transcriptional regulator n=1 Tax=Nocardia vermiculata TaxID=257274 RepID=A0A846XY89_9NOCA|nr:TetR/AcrR family transcriptional regulator [Nocardia vermiculata]NKY50321.1 TetR/AcrR family transcriptional regulator [Nocardia vermiculata]
MSPSRQVTADRGDPRPGRPQKRQAIIDAAQRVFSQRGFTHAGVDVIAAEAGVSKQTIYNHFGDKQALFTAVVHAVKTRVRAEMRHSFEAGYTESGDYDRDLRTSFRLLVRVLLSDSVAAMRRLVIAEQVRHPELAREWEQDRPTFEAMLTGQIEQHTAAGVLNVTDAPLAAHQLILLTANDAIERSGHGLHPLSDEEIATIVDNGVDMWMRCYGKNRNDTT